MLSGDCSRAGKSNPPFNGAWDNGDCDLQLEHISTCVNLNLFTRCVSTYKLCFYCVCIISKSTTVSVSEPVALNKEEPAFQNTSSKSPAQLSAEAASSRVEHPKCAHSLWLICLTYSQLRCDSLHVVIPTLAVNKKPFNDNEVKKIIVSYSFLLYIWSWRSTHTHTHSPEVISVPQSFPL